jgi:N-acylglucosamine 2-epimerase
MNLQNQQQLASVYRDGLLNDTLSFWFPRCLDREHGGYMIARDRDGSLLDTDKGVWQQCRTAWMLGELYNNTGSNAVKPIRDAVSSDQRETWLEAARSGIEFVDQHAFDPSDGRMWFHLTRDGRPIRKRRYAFTESFAAIAYGEYARATGSDEYAEKAADCFRRFVDHAPETYGERPKFTDVRPTRGIGPPMIAIVTAQELRESIGLESADAIIAQAIDDIRRFHTKPDLKVVMETVGPQGEILDHFDGRMLNPGHAIEASWFIMHEGERRNDQSLIQTGLDILDWMWERGWDEEHGGLLYFVDLNGRPVQEYWHDMKFWWPHNEAIIATLAAYSITGDEKYAAMHKKVHDWTYGHFPDAEHGEWYGYLHRDGTPSVTLKGNLWKGPFHMPRMQWTCWRRLVEATTE